jgi:L-methionine (R)-S-oxide reductase
LHERCGHDFRARVMTFAANRPAGTKKEVYRELLQQAEGLLEGEDDAIANAANLTSLIYFGLDDLNWVGFYFLKREELVLGPFQGKPACVRIGIGKGVCGAAVAQRRALIVPDVNEFPGHIPCDAASRSELVVPLTLSGKMLGVLDLDSPSIARFDFEDQQGIEALAGCWGKRSKLTAPLI